jgi:hypothetical protein
MRKASATCCAAKLLHKDYISRRPEKGGDLLKARNFSW